MKKNKLALFSAPYVLWMAVFVVIPILMIVVYAFSSAGGGFTLENFARIGDYMVVFTRSFKLAFIATAICLLLGYPVSCFLAREGPRFQRVAMMLIMLPMWMNFLLRTYAWMSLLENTGLLNRFFEAIGLFDLINGIFGTNLEYFKMPEVQDGCRNGEIVECPHQPATQKPEEAEGTLKDAIAGGAAGFGHHRGDGGLENGFLCAHANTPEGDADQQRRNRVHREDKDGKAAGEQG